MTLLAHQLTKIYSQAGESLEVLKDLEFALDSGESVAILGQSGSGKSTLLSLLAGLDYPSGGEVILNGKRLSALTEDELVSFRAQSLGIVFQQFHLMSNLTALENVMLPLEILGSREAEEKSRKLLEAVGLSERATHYPHQLSGGEKQRVAIARALATDAPVILADEPSGNLDTRTGTQVMDLLFSLTRSRGTALVLVTHNEVLARRCDRQLHLANGTLTEASPVGRGT